MNTPNKLYTAARIFQKSVCEKPDGFYYWEGNDELSTQKLTTAELAQIETAYAAEAVQYPLDQCKDEAKKRIAATDWAVLPDVGLANVTAFETYRAALRELIKNPVAEPVWPTEPDPIWS